MEGAPDATTRSASTRAPSNPSRAARAIDSPERSAPPRAQIQRAGAARVGHVRGGRETAATKEVEESEDGGGRYKRCVRWTGGGREEEAEGSRGGGGGTAQLSSARRGIRQACLGAGAGGPAPAAFLSAPVRARLCSPSLPRARRGSGRVVYFGCTQSCACASAGRSRGRGRGRGRGGRK